MKGKNPMEKNPPLISETELMDTVAGLERLGARLQGMQVAVQILSNDYTSIDDLEYVDKAIRVLGAIGAAMEATK